MTGEERRARKKANREAWYAAHREDQKAKMRARYAAKREEEKARVMAWRRANPDWVQANKRAYYAENRAEIRSRARSKKYGISAETYEKLVAEHSGLCALCGKSPNRLCIDHDHRTGRVRGLLCDTCNFHLGALEKILERGLGPLMISYLKRSGSL